MQSWVLVTGAALVLVLAACGTVTDPGDETLPSPARGAAESAPLMASEVPESPVGEFRCEPTAGGSEQTLGLLNDVSVTDLGSFTRIVFQFQPAAGLQPAVPRFQTTYAQPPFLDIPGDVLDLEGNVALEVVFFNASGYDSSQQYRRVYFGPTTIPLESPLTALTQSSDFEATLIWLVGMNQQACHAVLALDDPPRLVIDISMEGRRDFTG